MLDPQSALATKLKAHRVRIRDDGPGSVILQNVPANARYFNKRGTNVMVKQARAGLPYLVAVDEDLQYVGPDALLAKAFAAGTTQQGWRIVFLDGRVDAELSNVVEDALRAVGFGDTVPAWIHGSAGADDQPRRLALTQGEDLSERPCQTTVGRPDALEEVTAALLLARPRMPVILAESGVGKTHLLSAVAHECRAFADVRVIRFDLCRLFSGTSLEAERENLLVAVMGEAAALPGGVAALERFDLVFSETRHGPGLVAHAVESGARLIATAAPGLLPKLGQSVLARHLHVVWVGPLSAPDTTDVVRAAMPGLAAHHAVAADDWLADPIVELAGVIAGHFPAKALALADASLARARLAGSAALTLAHVAAAAAAFPELPE